jgi:dienelactone hydrolase
MDARGFGERKLGYMIDSGDDGCNINQIKAELLGLNTLTLNVFDLSRCIDYLLTRPEVDAGRIGCAGLSYGGTLTLFAAALDERIKVAVVSGYLTSFYDLTFVRGQICGQQIVPQLLRWGEISDVGCLIAPRPLLIESGTEDEGFGIDAARQAYAEVRRLYGVLDVPDKVAHHIFEGGHRWDGARTAEWLEQWL